MRVGPVTVAALRESGALGSQGWSEALKTPEGVIEAALPRFGELCAAGNWAEANKLARELHELVSRFAPAWARRRLRAAAP